MLLPRASLPTRTFRIPQVAEAAFCTWLAWKTVAKQLAAVALPASKFFPHPLKSCHKEGRESKKTSKSCQSIEILHCVCYRKHHKFLIYFPWMFSPSFLKVADWCGNCLAENVACVVKRPGSLKNPRQVRPANALGAFSRAASFVQGQSPSIRVPSSVPSSQSL